MLRRKCSRCAAHPLDDPTITPDLLGADFPKERSTPWTFAAVANGPRTKLSIETVQSEGPRAGEVLVEIKASGVRHTDAHTPSGQDSEGIFPSILGHEGAVVAEVCGVKSLKKGDHSALHTGVS